MEMAVEVLEVGAGRGGIRRGPRIRRALFWRAMNLRRGEEEGEGRG